VARWETTRAAGVSPRRRDSDAARPHGFAFAAAAAIYYPGRRVRPRRGGTERPGSETLDPPRSRTMLTAFSDPAELPARRFGKGSARSNLLTRRRVVAVQQRPACLPEKGSDPFVRPESAMAPRDAHGTPLTIQHG
jgi:hypothetical protein